MFDAIPWPQPVKQLADFSLSALFLASFKWCSLFSNLNIVSLRYFDPINIMYVREIHNFQGDPTDVPATTNSGVPTCALWSPAVRAGPMSALFLAETLVRSPQKLSIFNV